MEVGFMTAYLRKFSLIICVQVINRPIYDL